MATRGALIQRGALRGRTKTKLYAIRVEDGTRTAMAVVSALALGLGGWGDDCLRVLKGEESARRNGQVAMAAPLKVPSRLGNNLPPTGVDALRLAVPSGASVEAAKAMDKLYEVRRMLRIPQRKPYGDVANRARSALEFVSAIDDRDGEVMGELKTTREALEELITAAQDQDFRKVSSSTQRAQTSLSRIQVIKTPGLPFLIPAKLRLNYPYCSGRAEVRFTVTPSEDGEGFRRADTLELVPKEEPIFITVTLDGYSSPLSAGAFLNNVKNGTYDGLLLERREQAVLLNTKPEREGEEGGRTTSTSFPLEIMVRGENEPRYGEPLDILNDDIPKLPLSVYGAVVYAHPNERRVTESSTNDVFVYLHDKSTATDLGGLSFDEGTFSVFGYVTEGTEFLEQLKGGEKIISAIITEGEDRLTLPG